MLSAQEQETWEEIERGWADEAEEPDRPGAHRTPDRAERLPTAVVGGGWGAVLLVLFGVPWAGVAVGAAVTLLWLLWRFTPQLERAGVCGPDEEVRPC